MYCPLRQIFFLKYKSCVQNLICQLLPEPKQSDLGREGGRDGGGGREREEGKLLSYQCPFNLNQLTFSMTWF